MDPIMQQAAEVQGEIAMRFREPRFYAMKPGSSMAVAQAARIEMEYKWPSRYWLGFIRGIPDDARYLVMASMHLPGYFIQARAICCPKDQPIRKLGRAIALMRLAALVKALGWQVYVSTDPYGDRYIIPPLIPTKEDFPPCPAY